MPLFAPRPDPEALRRQITLLLLRGLEARLPELAHLAIRALDMGNAPEAVIDDLARMIAERLSQQQTRLDALNSQWQMDLLLKQIVEQENERLRNDPLHSELAEAQAQIEQMTGCLARAEVGLASAQRALEDSRHDVSELQAYILGQNRIIAQLQLRLNTLLGETPAAETTGETS